MDEDDRVETGAIQFNDDWPGLFVRGDDAFSLWVALRVAHKYVPDAGGFQRQTLREYADMIENEVKFRHDDSTPAD
jgi:hypothetical protein